MMDISNSAARPYQNFVSQEVDIKKYEKLYEDEGLLSIPNFITPSLCDKLKSDLDEYVWFTYSFTPVNNVWGEPGHFLLNSPLIQERFKECEKNREDGNFTYRFKRQFGKHFETCVCVTCRLYATLSDQRVIKVLEQITGLKELKPGEMFVSKYTKGDFLATHHDKNKGKITTTFCLTDNWDPNYGGILHFCDKDGQIYKSIVPKMGNLCIFRLVKEKQMDHFVSEVRVDKNRYMVSAWYY